MYTFRMGLDLPCNATWADLELQVQKVHDRIVDAMAAHGEDVEIDTSLIVPLWFDGDVLCGGAAISQGNMDPRYAEIFPDENVYRIWERNDERDVNPPSFDHLRDPIMGNPWE